MTTSASLLGTAVAAVDKASDLIRTLAPDQLTAKGDRDYASNVDFAVERTVREFLARATPDIAFLGEEEGFTGDVNARVWALDPVDGTVNFANSLPLCAVSLALVEDDRPILGVIQLPFLGSLYTAVSGEGAFRAGRRIAVAKPASVRESIVSIGDYAIGDDAISRNKPRLALTNLLAASALRVRMFGSAAIDLAWLAEGSIGATVMLSNKPWDTAAGVVIAREAGAQIVDLDGTAHTVKSSVTIAAAPTVIDEILALVQAATNPA